ncbi:MAG: amidophosphoribosyltransferase [Desulfobacterales bacterium]
MCGIVGMISEGPVSVSLYESLTALQHRGQDSSGMVTYSDHFHLKKGLGYVREVFDQADMAKLGGTMGIGHVRYATAGGGALEDVQPYQVNSPYGIALVHNGNVFNVWQLREELFARDLRQINSQNDAEVLLNVFASALSRTGGGDFLESISRAVESVYQRVRGAYSVVALIAGKGLVAFRDPHGIRPLVWGIRRSSAPNGHIFASENGMFDFLQYDYERDIEPGEVVYVDLKGQVRHQVVHQKTFRPCAFEYIYFARPDAFLNGVSVYRSRLRMGQNLAGKIKQAWPEETFDVVIPAPQSAVTAALACAHELGVRYTEAIVKNRFIGRTFIMPGQAERQRANRYKLSLIDFEVRGKNVLVVDDSIVRGNVSRHIVRMMRRYGARKVFFASAAPPLRWPDLYGIDLPAREDYIACNRSEEEIRQQIGADGLIYQEVDGLVEAITRKGRLRFTKPHMAFFDGDYATGDVTDEVLHLVEQKRKAETANG